MAEFKDLGFPQDVTTEELKNRLKSARENHKQIIDWIEMVNEEIRRRGG